MAKPVAGINPNILRWARERAGYTKDEAAAAIKKDISVIESWESGESSPTYGQLEKLAYTLYKRPLALFFFPSPPEEKKPSQQFRTLPDFEIEKLDSDTLYALREAEAMQSALEELNEGTNPSENIIFRDIMAKPDTPLKHLAKIVRDYLGVTLEEQSSWKNNDEALKQWRALIQDNGVFVFKRSFKQKNISGFCLFNNEFPLIYLNNSTAPSRQSFTLFHELAHILLNSSGITIQNNSYIDSLTGIAKKVEVFINQFAAEFLVPSGDFQIHLGGDPYDDKYIAAIAARYLVSREVILRRFLDNALVDHSYYETKSKEWSQDLGSGRKGGNYYATKATYLGDKYLELVFKKYYHGHIGIEQLAHYLNVKVKNVPGLEQFALKRAAV